MPVSDVISPSLASHILSVRQDKDRYFAIIQLYPAIEANSADHKTVRKETQPRFSANEVRAMAVMFNKKEAYWPLYTYFEHQQTPNSLMGQVKKMWYDEKGKWMNAKVELNSAAAYQRILKENLSCSMCFARTGNVKELLEFSFVADPNFVNSKVTSVYRNSSGNHDSDHQDFLFPPNHNGVVHFIKLDAGPWIEINSANPQMEDDKQQQQQQPASSSSSEEVKSTGNEQNALDDDLAEFASLDPENQQKLARVMLSRAHEAEKLKLRNEQLEKGMADMNAEKERLEQEQRIGNQMDLARTLVVELKGDQLKTMSQEQVNKDIRALATELAFLAGNENTSLYTDLISRLTQKINDTRQFSQSRDSSLLAASARQKEISEALRSANVRPMSIEANMSGSAAQRRKVPGGSRLFQSLLSEVSQRAPPSANAPLMAHLEKEYEAHSAKGFEKEEQEEDVIDALYKQEMEAATRFKKNSFAPSSDFEIEANSAGAHEDSFSQFASETGTNVHVFLRQHGLLGGPEGDRRNEALRRAGTHENAELVIERHSAQTETTQKSNVAKRKALEPPSTEERRKRMYGDIGAAVDGYVRRGEGERLNNTMLLRDPKLFNFAIDQILKEDNAIPTNAHFGHLDKKGFLELSPEEQEDQRYWFLKHRNFERAQIKPEQLLLTAE